ncbi:hypothetical protein HDU91_005626 [Kappamyces sp. JEL0680]|nr:hypothetical protein HDU91_005626 [Kappamyces sp. JEL0680]
MGKPTAKAIGGQAPTSTHKRKTPKKQAKSIKDGAINAEEQGIPKQFRRMLLWQNSLNAREAKKISNEPKKNQKIEEQSLKEKLNHLTHETAMAGKRKTKKYLKKKEFLKKKSSKKLHELPKDEMLEQKLQDRVRFGERVQEPPKLTVVPKRKSAVSTTAKVSEPVAPQRPNLAKKPVDQRPMKDLEGLQKVGRTRKLKTLPESEKVALLNERNKLIALYRSKKTKPSTQ